MDTHFNNIKISTLILSLLITEIASSGPATDQLGNDIGYVYSIIRGSNYAKEICAENFPEFINQNEIQYQKWRIKYNIAEIEEDISASLRREFGANSKKYREALIEIDNILVDVKKQFETELRKNGERGLQMFCRRYPEYLTIKQTNIEYCCAERVARIRQSNAK